MDSPTSSVVPGSGHSDGRGWSRRTNASPGTMADGLIGAIQRYLSGRAELDQEAVKEWADDLRELDSRSEFFFSYLQFLVNGTA